jgi:hypothetical protein
VDYSNDVVRSNSDAHGVGAPDSNLETPISDATAEAMLGAP